jgi:hypothetical protein
MNLLQPNQTISPPQPYYAEWRHMKMKTSKAFLTQLEEGEMNKPAKPNPYPPPSLNDDTLKNKD